MYIAYCLRPLGRPDHKVPTIEKLKADRSQLIEERNTLGDEYKKIAAELVADYNKIKENIYRVRMLKKCAKNAL